MHKYFLMLTTSVGQSSCYGNNKANNSGTKRSMLKCTTKGMPHSHVVQTGLRRHVPWEAQMITKLVVMPFRNHRENNHTDKNQDTSKRNTQTSKRHSSVSTLDDATTYTISAKFSLNLTSNILTTLFRNSSQSLNHWTEDLFTLTTK